MTRAKLIARLAEIAEQMTKHTVKTKYADPKVNYSMSAAQRKRMIRTIEELRDATAAAEIDNLHALDLARKERDDAMRKLEQAQFRTAFPFQLAEESGGAAE